MCLASQCHCNRTYQNTQWAQDSTLRLSPSFAVCTYNCATVVVVNVLSVTTLEIGLLRILMGQDTELSGGLLYIDGNTRTEASR